MELNPLHAPSLEKAREFSLRQLPRRAVDHDGKGFRLVRPQVRGKENAVEQAPDEVGELYPLTVDTEELADFGIGVGLYFDSLQGMSAVMFLCALVTVPVCYQNYALQVASNMTNQPEWNSMLAGSFYGSKEITYLQGITDMLVCLILLTFAVVSENLMNKRAADVDTERQTADDFTVVVKNPLPEHKVDDYYNHFKKFGDICVITVIKKNTGAYLAACAEQHNCKENLDYAELVEHTSEADPILYDDLTWYQKLLQDAGIAFLDSIYWRKQQAVATERIKELERANTDTSSAMVYITFNEEESQRACVAEYELGALQRLVMSDNLEDRLVQIAPDPSDINWENQGVDGLSVRLSQLISYAFSAVLLAVSLAILWNLSQGDDSHSSTEDALVTSTPSTAGSNSSSSSSLTQQANDYINQGVALGSAMFVVLFNASLPTIFYYICLNELHYTKTGAETAMMQKLLIVRFANTAVLSFLVTKNSNFLDATTLKKIQNILVADLFTTNFLRFFDPYTTIMRYGVAPTMLTQKKMNEFFRGAVWNLGERYTDVMKTVFVSVFYAQILPTGMFVTCAALALAYAVDKYLLLRWWEIPPFMSDKIGRNARAFFCLIIYAHIWVTFWMYSRWPFATVPIIDEGYYKFDILPSNALNWTSTNFTCEESYTISCWEQWGMRASSGISFAAMNQFGYIGYICLITISSMLVFYVFVWQFARVLAMRILGGNNYDAQGQAGRIPWLKCVGMPNYEPHALGFAPGEFDLKMHEPIIEKTYTRWSETQERHITCCMCGYDFEIPSTWNRVTCQMCATSLNVDANGNTGIGAPPPVARPVGMQMPGQYAPSNFMPPPAPVAVAVPVATPVAHAQRARAPPPPPTSGYDQTWVCMMCRSVNSQDHGTCQWCSAPRE